MAKISANYEVVYILDPAQGEEAIAANVASSRLWLSSTAAPTWSWMSGASVVLLTPSITRPKATMC